MSQSQTFEKTRPYYILKYDVSVNVPGYQKALIKSVFASERLSTRPLPEELSKGKIVAIDYYYTQFKTAESFVQVNLDSLRFRNLALQFPQVHAQIDSVPVRFVEQTLAQTAAEAKYFFHGFVIYYQLIDPPISARADEIALLNRLFDHDFTVDDTPEYGQMKEITGGRPGDFMSFYGEMIHLSEPDTVVVVDRRFLQTEIKKQKRDAFATCYQVVSTKNRNKVAIKIFEIPKGRYPGSAPPPFQAGIGGLMEKSMEESRLRLLARKTEVNNELSTDFLSGLQRIESDSLVLVLDVTGSMVPALADVLKWMHQGETKRRIKGVVLFNDGDGMENEKKRNGKVGGIYFVDDLADLKPQMIKAIQNGSGGDLPENDIEAVVAAREHYGAGNYILVADNIAPPRDILSLYQIDFPLSILLCNGIEPKASYLDLLNHSKGTLINRK